MYTFPACSITTSTYDRDVGVYYRANPRNCGDPGRSPPSLNSVFPPLVNSPVRRMDVSCRLSRAALIIRGIQNGGVKEIRGDSINDPSSVWSL